MTRKTVKQILPWLLLGPLTGLLAAGVVRNWRVGNITLSLLYGLAFAVTTYDIFALDGRLMAVAASHL